MILVADSGSTKCDWVLKDDASEISCSTMGFNPFFHTTQEVINGIQTCDVLRTYSHGVKQIFYYGAGCQSNKLKAKIAAALKICFPNAEIVVDDDMAGAVLAICNGKAGITCILGTGSNAAYYDGEKINMSAAGLGYVLGDEASGTYFGKKIAAHFIYGLLPNVVNEKMLQAGYSRNNILDQVYKQPRANVFLASLMPIITEFNDEPKIKTLLFDGFCEFIKLHVLSFKTPATVQVHFVGSVAYFNQEILKESCLSKKIQLGTIIQKPIGALKQIHGS